MRSFFRNHLAGLALFGESRDDRKVLAPPKPSSMAGNVVKASEELVRVAGQMTPTPKAGAAALALALGRVCTIAEVDLDTVLALVRLAAAGDNLGFLAVRAQDEEELLRKR